MEGLVDLERDLTDGEVSDERVSELLGQGDVRELVMLLRHHDEGL